MEHILLESDEREVPTLETARRIHARLVLHGGRWRRSMELALIDYFYLSVRTARAQTVDARYVVDLRFVDPAPRLKRRVAWRWIAACGAFLALGIFGARDVADSTAPWWRHEWLPVTAALFGVAACALFAAFHLTTETLTLFSAHGGRSSLHTPEAWERYVRSTGSCRGWMRIFVSLLMPAARRTPSI